MKWAELALEPNEAQARALSQFMSDQGIANTYELLSVSRDDFLKALEKAKTEFEHVRIGPPFRHLAASSFKSQSSFMRLLQSCDCLVQTDSQWWPRSALYAAIESILKEVGHCLELDASILIVGAGASSRPIIAALVKMGFKKIGITSMFNDEVNVLLQDLRRVFFDVQFELIPRDQLILRPGNSSLVVNTTPLLKSNRLLEELYYFNFLRRDGMVWDLTLVPPRTPLLKEAEEVGIASLGGEVFASRSDCQWVEWASGRKLDHRLLEKKYLEELSKVDFDLEEFEEIRKLT